LNERGRVLRSAKLAKIWIADRQQHAKATLPKLFDESRKSKAIGAARRLQQGQAPARPVKIGAAKPLMPPQKIVAPDFRAPVEIKRPCQS
jgi:hypothetical protein